MNSINTNLKMLIGGAEHKFSHLKEFAKTFEELGGRCRLDIDIDIVRGFPSKNFAGWFSPYKKFNKLITQFNPDLVFIDRQSQYGIAAINAELPLFVHLRGDYWSEIEWSKQTINSSFKSRTILHFKEKIAYKCFENAKVILPLSNHLSKIVREHYPDKPIETFHQGINPELWYKDREMNLKHPCVGLIQDATIWGKTKEILTLKNVLNKMSNVMFYWVGDGPYREKIISEMKEFKNFQWLGRLSHPDGIRKFLSSIDVYALVTGFDTLGMTTQEAQLMEKPVIVTRTGGTPESMKSNVSGFLIDIGDYQNWIEKLTLLINDKETSFEMGKAGKNFVIENFSWDKKTSDFIKICKKYI